MWSASISPQAAQFIRMDAASSDLIQGVEAGDLKLVQRALRAGADPNNARKTVELRVDIDSGETVTDTQLMEPVLALAILVGDVQVLQLLLEAVFIGADPDKPISWGVARHYFAWTKWRWEGERWFFGGDFMSYPSALDFALANGSDWPFNKKGSHIVLVNPSEPEHVGDKYTLIPSLDVVRLLLRQGARVTDTAMEKARWMTREGRVFISDAICEDAIGFESTDFSAVDTPAHNAQISSDKWGRVFPPKPEFLHLLEFHLTFLKQLTKVNADLQLRLEHTQRTMEGLQERAAEADRLARQLDDLQAQVREKDVKIAELERLRGGKPPLPNPMYSHTRGASLTGPAPGAVSAKHHSIASSLADRVAARGNLPQPVGRLFYAIHSYSPQDTDEIHLSLGDQVWCLFQFSDGWGAGTNRMTTQSGYFPMICLGSSPPDANSRVLPTQLVFSARSASSLKVPQLHVPSMMSSVTGSTSSSTLPAPSGLVTARSMPTSGVLENGNVSKFHLQGGRTRSREVNAPDDDTSDDDLARNDEAQFEGHKQIWDWDRANGEGFQQKERAHSQIGTKSTETQGHTQTLLNRKQEALGQISTEVSETLNTNVPSREIVDGGELQGTNGKVWNRAGQPEEEQRSKWANAHAGLVNESAASLKSWNGNRPDTVEPKAREMRGSLNTAPNDRRFEFPGFSFVIPDGVHGGKSGGTRPPQKAILNGFPKGMGSLPSVPFSFNIPKDMPGKSAVSPPLLQSASFDAPTDSGPQQSSSFTFVLSSEQARSEPVRQLQRTPSNNSTKDRAPVRSSSYIQPDGKLGGEMSAPPRETNAELSDGAFSERGIRRSDSFIVSW
ncbi:hypothetical protein HDU93_008051 [Gonapodya sp. JEL0774]|nr:hypothetical protein HDU93_008051 [Gonapodya sp. JEL0774]